MCFGLLQASSGCCCFRNAEVRRHRDGSRHPSTSTSSRVDVGVHFQLFAVPCSPLSRHPYSSRQTACFLESLPNSLAETFRFWRMSLSPRNARRTCPYSQNSASLFVARHASINSSSPQESTYSVSTSSLLADLFQLIAPSGAPSTSTALLQQFDPFFLTFATSCTQVCLIHVHDHELRLRPSSTSISPGSGASSDV